MKPVPTLHHHNTSALHRFLPPCCSAPARSRGAATKPLSRPTAWQRATTYTVPRAHQSTPRPALQLQQLLLLNTIS